MATNAQDQEMSTRDHYPTYQEDPNAPPTKQLFNYVNYNTYMNIEPCFPNFGTLQRFNLTHIQQELAKWKIDVKAKPAADEGDMKKLRQLLHEYGT